MRMHLLFCLFLLLVGCQTNVADKGPKEYKFDDMPSQLNAKVDVGQEFVFVLQENMTTGYSWEVVENKAKVPVSLEHQGAKTRSIRGVPLVGAPGTAVVKITPDKKGKCTVKLGYRRPWEKNAPIYNVTVNVNAK